MSRPHAAKAAQAPLQANDPRARGLTRLHAAQRVAYRDKIIRAAMDVFIEKSYVATTVDDILTRADVSRPTFYRYFDSKFDLAVSLIRSKAAEAQAPYDAFVATGEASRGNVFAMMASMMRTHERNAAIVRVMTEIAVLNPEYLDEVDAAFRRAASRLGTLLPAFSPRGHGARMRTARARILLNQIATSCQLACVKGGKVERAAVIDLLTEQFLAFAREG